MYIILEAYYQRKKLCPFCFIIGLNVILLQLLIYLNFRNGPEWFRIRTVFQKGLSSPSSVKHFLKRSDEIIQEWLTLVEEVSKKPNVDYLPELSRLFLERTLFIVNFSSNDKFDIEILYPLIHLKSYTLILVTGQAVLDVRLNSFSKEEHAKNSRTSKLINAALETNSCILKTDNGLQLWRKFETPLYKRLRKSQEYMEE